MQKMWDDLLKNIANIARAMNPLFCVKTWSFSIAFVVYLCMVHTCSCTSMAGEQPMNVPAIFAFGDSIVDAGNNNNILFTVIRCNWPPNGKDFEGQKATGRFGNGRLSTDFIVERLGIKKNLPAYLDKSLQIQDLLTGVSFASSGSGYDSQTSTIGSVYSIDDQIDMFREYCEKVERAVGVERTNSILDNSIFFVVSGSCDLANTYFTLPFRRPFYDINSYTDLMVKRSTYFFEKLHELGARKIAVSNVPPIGYLPVERTLWGGILTRDVVEYFNDASQLFNGKLKISLDELSIKLLNSTLIYMDTYSIFLDLVHNSKQYGFKVIDRGCCGTGLVEVAVLCTPFSFTCENDKEYLFWDSFHPSEKAYELIAKRILKDYFNISPWPLPQQLPSISSH